MLIFVQPMYSKQELNADSNYVVYTAWIRAMRKVRPRWHFIVSFPDAASGFRYADDGFFRQPNVTRLPMRISPRKHGSAVQFDSVWYDKLLRTVGLNGVWCNLVEIAGQIRHSGETTLDRTAKPTVVAAHNYVIHSSLPYPWEGMEVTALSQLMGAIASNVNVYNSNHCRQMLYDTAARYLNASALARIAENEHIIPYGTLEDEWPERASEHNVPVIIYNHRLQMYKNWRDTFEILQQLWDEGVRFEVHYLNNTSENVKFIQSLPFVRVHLCATRAEYLQRLAVGDLNVTNSSHETFCISAIESMAFGQPMVAPAGVTFPEITGAMSGNGYPYLFSSATEQVEMLRELLLSRDKRRHWGDVVRKHVRENYSQSLWATRYAELFEAEEARLVPNVTPDALEFFDRTLRAGGRRSIHELIRDLHGKTVNGRVPFSSQSMTYTRAIRVVASLGGTVEFVGGVQYVEAAR